MPLAEIAAHLPKDLAEEALAHAAALTEIRIRAGRPCALAYGGADAFVGPPLTLSEVKRIALSMMEHSYYAREEELNQGYFTMRGGSRVGVCGSCIVKDGACFLQSIGSLCIRVAREIPGCGAEIAALLSQGGALKSALVLSKPGMGKTTLLRDAARILSEGGRRVGIADERHELAACRDGVPSVDVGPRTDVADGCPKALGMERLIRCMAPEVIVTDEIGNPRDAWAVREAARRGVALLASAHAGGFDALENGPLGALIRDGLFQTAVLLDGAPGQIAGIRHYERGGKGCV